MWLTAKWYLNPENDFYKGMPLGDVIHMVEKVAQHTHCQICGKAIPVSETLCSEECKQRYQSLLKKRRILVYVMYASIFVVLLLFAMNILAS